MWGTPRKWDRSPRHLKGLLYPRQWVGMPPRRSILSARWHRTSAWTLGHTRTHALGLWAPQSVSRMTAHHPPITHQGVGIGGGGAGEAYAPSHMRPDQRRELLPTHPLKPGRSNGVNSHSRTRRAGSSHTAKPHLPSESSVSTFLSSSSEGRWEER